MIKALALVAAFAIATTSTAEAKNSGDAWAAAGIGLIVGGVLGALSARPTHVVPAAPVGVVPGMNMVPGCYYAAFVDVYGRQFFRQICN